MSKQGYYPPPSSDDEEPGNTYDPSELPSYDEALARLNAYDRPPPDEDEKDKNHAQKIKATLANLAKFGREGPAPDYYVPIKFDKGKVNIEKEKETLKALTQQLSDKVAEVREHLSRFDGEMLGGKLAIQKWAGEAVKQIAFLKNMHSKIQKSKKIIHQLGEKKNDFWDDVDLSDEDSPSKSSALKDAVDELQETLQNFSEDPEPTADQIRAAAKRKSQKVEQDEIDNALRLMRRAVGKADVWIKSLPKGYLSMSQGSSERTAQAQTLTAAIERHIEEVQLLKAAVRAVEAPQRLQKGKFSGEERFAFDAAMLAVQDAIALCQDPEPTAETFKELEDHSKSREEDESGLTMFKRQLDGEIDRVQTWMRELRGVKMVAGQVSQFIEEAKRAITKMVRAANKVRKQKAILHLGPRPQKAANIDKLRSMLLQIWDQNPDKADLKNFKGQDPDRLKYTLEDTYRQAEEHRRQAMELIDKSTKTSKPEKYDKEAGELIAQITLTFMWMRQAKATLMGSVLKKG